MKREELKIASPCHENFDDMQGAGAKRFCDSCSKSVTNLSDMTKTKAEQFLKASAGTTVCVRYEFNRDGQVIFDRPTDRVQRQVHGARKLLAAAALVMIPLLGACGTESTDCQTTAPESLLIQSERAILDKLKTVGIDLESLMDEIDPFEEVVMGEMAMVEPIPEPDVAQLEEIPDELILPAMGQMAQPAEPVEVEMGEMEAVEDVEPVRVVPVRPEPPQIRMGKIKVSNDRRHDSPNVVILP